jgi:quercetin dioxygenase-like cupin family protein
MPSLNNWVSCSRKAVQPAFLRERNILVLSGLRKSAITVATLAAMTFTFTATVAQEATPTADAYGGELVKEVLVSEDQIEAAPGEILTLTRYIIPPGAELPVHTHPGVQMASVESGVFTYTVVEGEVYVTRADDTEETFSSGDTVTFNEGDSWIEPEGMIHFAQNLSDGEVILISTALLDSDEDATILVELPATPEATPAA